MAPPPTDDPSSTSQGSDEWAAFAEALIASRQNVSPRRLTEPGPDARQRERLFQAAAAAPDHNQLRPWRFVVVPQARRAALADVFARALRERDAAATAEQLDSARDKAYRAPLLLLAVARLEPADPGVPAAERLISLGAALQNMLLSAHAMGYGAGLTGGQALRSPALRDLFRLAAGEEAVCFVNVGRVTERKPMRARPSPSDFVEEL